MHRKYLFQKLITELSKKGINEYNIEYLIKTIKHNLIVTDKTASKYVKEMVSWGIIKYNGNKFENNYYKKES